MHRYSIVVFIINNKKYYCLWYENELEKDVFLLDEMNKIRCFNAEELQDYCKNENFLSEEPVFYSIDKLSAWLDSLDKNVDCEFILNMWNIFADLAYTVQQDYCGDKDEYTHIYSKLFYGNNLPSINTSGRTYLPEWDEEEFGIIVAVMQNGLALVTGQIS